MLHAYVYEQGLGSSMCSSYTLPWGGQPETLDKDSQKLGVHLLCFNSTKDDTSTGRLKLD